MDLTDIQVALIRLWAHADWRYVAAHFGGIRAAAQVGVKRTAPRTPEPISAPIDTRDDARLVLDANCWHADYSGVWAGGATGTSSAHRLAWPMVSAWLNGWPVDDRNAALDALLEFEDAVGYREDEAVRWWHSAAQQQAARDRREVRLERGGYRAIRDSRLTVQALIDRNLEPQPAISAARFLAGLDEPDAAVRGVA